MPSRPLVRRASSSFLCMPAFAVQPAENVSPDLTAKTSELVFLPPGLVQTMPDVRCSAVGQGTDPARQFNITSTLSY